VYIDVCAHSSWPLTLSMLGDGELPRLVFAEGLLHFVVAVGAG
jgi:hypothetical protein